ERGQRPEDGFLWIREAGIPLLGNSTETVQNWDSLSSLAWKHIFTDEPEPIAGRQHPRLRNRNSSHEEPHTSLDD
ncbi:MAG TPA: hypothetical protein VKG86_03120, partial [Terracidiphilus sp.]|nr:hypothetical protein [Terracidiphilus sp.]